MTISSTTEAVADLNLGRMVLLIDEACGGEGHLAMLAERVTPDAVNFMARHGRGLVCLALSDERCERLGLAGMPAPRPNCRASSYTVSIEAAHGVSTGISAADRAVTILAAVAPGAAPGDLVQPGHIFPIRAARGGVLERAGCAEAAIDLAASAGAAPAAVTCCVLDEAGSVADADFLQAFAASHGLRIVRVGDVLEHRARLEPVVERCFERSLHTALGSFRMVGYRDRSAGALHLALVHGNPAEVTTSSVRVHFGAGLLDALEVQPGRALAAVPASLSAIGRRNAGIVLLVGGGAPDEPADRLQRPPHSISIQEIVASMMGGADRIRRTIVAGILAELGAAAGEAPVDGIPEVPRSVGPTMAFIEY